MQIKCHKMIDQKYSLCDQDIKLLYVLPEEVVSYKNQLKVNVSDVLVKSPNRVPVICPIFERCGGCDYLYVNYKHQITMKNEYVKSMYSGIKTQEPFDDLKPSDYPLNYRHKVVLSATTHKKRLKLGLYQENSKTVIPYLDCHIQDKTLNEILKTVEEVLNKFKLTPYDIDAETGIIKHIFLRKSYHSNDVLLCFVTQGQLLPNHKNMIKIILEKHKEVKTVLQNIHRKKTKFVLLDEDKVLYGPGFIYDQINGIKFRLSLKSFYQINPMQMEHLYQKAIELGDIRKTDNVLDCYSGIGTLSLLLSQKAKHVYAVEINPKAHQDAKFNQRLNHINNVTFVNADVAPFIKEFDKQIDVLVMDPTREGASKVFLEAVLELKPKKIVYISCDPQTQLRDIKMLLSKFEVVVVKPVDMFSQTVHVETIALLSLKNSS